MIFLINDRAGWTELQHVGWKRVCGHSWFHSDQHTLMGYALTHLTFNFT